MQQQFLKYCKQIRLSKGSKILLALSGGLDSMALLHLLHQTGFTVEAAHCNFKLRGQESEADEKFVNDSCLSLGVPLHVKCFNTEDQAKDAGVSIQMAARDLRYAWFDTLCTEFGFDLVATAHHRDDQIETVLINLSRGTGLKGMRGILPIQNKRVRPFLFTDRAALELWMHNEKHAYKEDSSNTSLAYTRNKLRHQVVPILKEVNPSLSASLQENAERFAGIEKTLSFLLEKERQTIVLQKGNTQHFSLSVLANYPSPVSVLYYFLSDYGFQDWQAMANMLQAESGKMIYSQSHELLKDREVLVLREKPSTQEKVYSIEMHTEHLSKPFKFTFSCLTVEGFKLDTTPTKAALDYDALTFPLELRRWRQGDVFYPLGLNGKKKLSDFFIDQKKSLFEKENTWLLCSNDQIVWVVGSRIDERFKLVEKTQKVYLAELNDILDTP